jgi:DNA-cytosine methyltransferase
MKVLDLFSGIGGFSYGLESTGGFETVAFAECEPYPIAVLKKHWPTVRVYEDVRQITATRLFRDGIEPDVITGGFPCQDISTAGQQAGIEGERSGLWSECARILGEVRPRYAIFENVTNLLSGNEGKWFERVLWDISSVGYDAEWHCISASSIGAPHKRDRVWIVAYPNGNSKPICPINAGALQKASLHSNPHSLRLRKQNKMETKTKIWGKDAGYVDPLCSNVSYTNRKGLEGSEETRDTSSKRPESHEQLTGCHKIKPTWKDVSGVCGMDDGLSYWLHTPEPPRVTEKNEKATPRLKALGNSIVPQIAYLIGQEILNYEESLCQQQ